MILPWEFYSLGKYFLPQSSTVTKSKMVALYEDVHSHIENTPTLQAITTFHEKEHHLYSGSGGGKNVFIDAPDQSDWLNGA